MRMKRGVLAAVVFAVVIVLDQVLKIWVKTHFYLHESVEVASWFRLLFVENNGMAFGMELGSKLFLTLFRIVVVGVLIWWIVKLSREGRARRGAIVCLTLIAAGAFGNIIDCVFYGLIFNAPQAPEVAVLFPPDGGYAPLFFGKVVDMLYFPLFSFDWPSWVPVVGGEHFVFFQPVFNLADAAITCGLLAMMIFYSGKGHFMASESERSVAGGGEAAAG